MASEQRRLLEQLMGPDLDSSRPRRPVDLHDGRVCSSFLVGACVHDMFVGTKADLGPCPRLHREAYRLEYERLKQLGRDTLDLDRDHERSLFRHVDRTDRAIAAAKARLQKTPEDMARINERTTELQDIERALALTLEQLELLGRSGEIMRALCEMRSLDELRLAKIEKEKEIKLISERGGFSGHQQLQVCSVCGAYLSRLDPNEQLADHFLGRLHLSFVRLRREHEAAKERLH